MNQIIHCLVCVLLAFLPWRRKVEIVFKEDGTVQTKMKEHIKDAIDGFKDDITKPVVTPATWDLFEINEDCPKLSVEDSEKYHSTTAKLLYLETGSFGHSIGSRFSMDKSLVLQ